MSQVPVASPSGVEIPVVAVLPVGRDDPDAPDGCAALRELCGRSLLQWAVGSLMRSGPVRRVVVLAPPELVGGLESQLAPEPGVELEVLSSAWSGVAGLRSIPESLAGEPGIVLVHDPLHPLAPAELVGAVVEALAVDAGASGAVPLGPVTDTVKWVDEDGAVLGTADRDAFRTVHSPQAYRLAPLLAALAAVDADALRSAGLEALPGRVRAAGGRLCCVPAPAEALRVATTDDLVLGGAVLGGAVLGGS